MSDRRAGGGEHGARARASGASVARWCTRGSRVGSLFVAALSSVATARAGEGDSADSDPPRRSFLWFPEEECFEPLLADPREPRVQGSIQRMDTDFGDFKVATATLGETFGLLRLEGSRPNDAVQLSIAGAAISFFNLDGFDNDLVNVDYFVGFPISARQGPWSFRVGPYHQSSHLSHEFFDNLAFGPLVEADKLSFEYFEALASRDLDDFRLYGGATRILSSLTRLDRWWAVAGAEWRAASDEARVLRPVAAVHVRAWQQTDWDPEWHALAGVEVTPRPDSRSVRFAFTFSEGPLEHGTFHRHDVRTIGFSTSLRF